MKIFTRIVTYTGSVKLLWLVFETQLYHSYKGRPSMVTRVILSCVVFLRPLFTY